MLFNFFKGPIRGAAWSVWQWKNDQLPAFFVLLHHHQQQRQQLHQQQQAQRCPLPAGGVHELQNQAQRMRVQMCADIQPRVWSLWVHCVWVRSGRQVFPVLEINSSGSVHELRCFWRRPVNKKLDLENPTDHYKINYLFKTFFTYSFSMLFRIYL